jgi:hypothetical protein
VGASINATSAIGDFSVVAAGRNSAWRFIMGNKLAKWQQAKMPRVDRAG